MAQVLYGTLDGSLGQLIQIPKFTYYYLKCLSEKMDNHCRGISRITTREQRQVKFDTGQWEDAMNVIDGDYLEQFLAFDEHRQAQIATSIMEHHADPAATQAYLHDVREIFYLL